MHYYKFHIDIFIFFFTFVQNMSPQSFPLVLYYENSIAYPKFLLLLLLLL